MRNCIWCTPFFRACTGTWIRGVGVERRRRKSSVRERECERIGPHHRSCWVYLEKQMDAHINYERVCLDIFSCFFSHVDKKIAVARFLIYRIYCRRVKKKSLVYIIFFWLIVIYFRDVQKYARKEVLHIDVCTLVVWCFDMRVFLCARLCVRFTREKVPKILCCACCVNHVNFVVCVKI